MDIHYYMLCNHCEALVASHLEPEAFGLYMAVGTRKLTRGHQMFLEIDPGLKSGYFRLEDIRQRCAPHPDGAPKRSKYISVYRVLEHLELSMMGKLYLTTIDGRVLGLEPSVYDLSLDAPGPNLYLELCPMTPMVVSMLPPAEFCRVMTAPDNPVACPRLLFADLLFDRDEDGRMAGYLPYADPMHIMDCIDQLVAAPEKPTKTVSRSPYVFAFYRTIRRGFFLGDQRGMKFYHFPPVAELEVRHAKWWRSASFV